VGGREGGPFVRRFHWSSSLGGTFPQYRGCPRGELFKGELWARLYRSMAIVFCAHAFSSSALRTVLGGPGSPEGWSWGSMIDFFKNLNIIAGG